MAESKDPVELSAAALMLAEWSWSHEGLKSRVKVGRLIQIAVQGALQSGLLVQAIWAYLWLRDSTNMVEEALALERELANRLGRKPRPKSKVDDHLPLPTPFQEFSAKWSAEDLGTDEIIREQLKDYPSIQFPLFSNLKVSEVARLLRVAEYRRVQLGDCLFKEGDIAKGFYVVAAGVFELESTSGLRRKCGPNSFLGELALFGEMPHSALARAQTEARLVYFSSDRLEDPFRSIPRLKEEFHDLVHRHLFMAVSSHSLIFRFFDPEELDQCWDYFVPIQVSRGQLLMEPKMSPDRFFLILRGKVEVIRAGEKAIQLGAGHFIGERGLILQQPRTASVRTISECLLLECDRWSYEELKERFPRVRDAINAHRTEYESYVFSSKNLVID